MLIFNYQTGVLHHTQEYVTYMTSTSMMVGNTTYRCTAREEDGLELLVTAP